MLTLIAIALFVLGYLAITLEHNFKVNKSAIALSVGGFLWILAAFIKPEHLSEVLSHTGSEIFEIVMFLLSAMSLVEVLVHYQFFDIVKAKIHAFNLDDKKQFVLLTVTTFFLSGVIDNLTATLVMLFIAKQFFKEKNLLCVATGIVVSANAGGAFSPIGDVTTIMLWLAGKFSAGEIIMRGFLPSLTMAGTVIALLYPRIKNGDRDASTSEVQKLSRSEKIVIAITFSSFSLPLAMNFLGLPPYIGLLIGLGLVWITIDIFKQITNRKTHLSVSLEDLIAKTDLASIKFFVGILLAVAALNYIGVLSEFGNVVYGQAPSANRIIAGNTALGLLSSVLDNVPLTAMTLKILSTPATSLWILLALTVGTGGSLLIVGSAAGVIAMGAIQDLDFKTYLKIAFVPVIVAYIAAISVWYAQYRFFPIDSSITTQVIQTPSESME